MLVRDKWANRLLTIIMLMNFLAMSITVYMLSEYGDVVYEANTVPAMVVNALGPYALFLNFILVWGFAWFLFINVRKLKGLKTAVISKTLALIIISPGVTWDLFNNIRVLWIILGMY